MRYSVSGNNYGENRTIYKLLIHCASKLGGVPKTKNNQDSLETVSFN